MTLKNLLTIILFFLFSQLTASAVAQSGDDEYKTAITQGDNYFKSGDYINAKVSYQYASKLKPDEKYPKDRLQESINKIRDKMVVVEQFTAVVAVADKHFRAEEWEQAKLKYAEAKKILPDDPYPDQQLNEIKRIADEAAAKETEYATAIANGEKFIKYRKYGPAKNEFEKALQVKPNEQYPKDKIAELTILIDETEKVKAEYDATIAGADRLYNLKYYENARKEYEKALNAKPDEPYPASQISEIDKILVKKNEYDKLVQAGDESYMNKNLDAAKASYQAALKIYPDENYPKTMIDKVNSGLVTSASNKDALYQKAIEDADKFLLAKDYTNALKEYQNASGLKPSEEYPVKKIAEVKGLLDDISNSELDYNRAVQRGEQFIAQKDYPSARTEFTKASQLKPNEAYPKEKLEEINLLQKEQDKNQASFNQSVAKAEEYFKNKNYDQALGEYQKALVIIPGQKMVLDRIEEINAIKSNQADKDQKISLLLTEADNLFNKASYSAAKAKYNEVLVVDPQQETAKTRLAEIDVIQKAQQEKENDYNRAIASADMYFKNQEYKSARNEYQKASDLKPSEQYPAAKLIELNKIIGDQELQQSSYDQLIASADKLFEEGKYEQAKIEYQKALDLKPGEKHPADRVTEIDAILASREMAMNLYNQTIASADNLMAAGDFNKAIAEYQSAIAMRPTEQYPKDKIAEIDRIKKEKQSIDEQYNKAMADGNLNYQQKDYDQALIRYKDAAKLKPQEQAPAEKIAEITSFLSAAAESDKNYNEAIQQADDLFKLKQYEEANLLYMKASNIKTKEQYPRDKMVEIDQLILQQKSAMAEYNQYISAGDRMIEAKEYIKAKEKFNLALTIKPDEQYPQDKLREIESILVSQELALQESYNDLITEGDNLFTAKEYGQAKMKYQEALKFKPEEPYPVQKLGEIERLVSDLKTLELNYQKMIADADVKFKAKEYQEAKTKYIEASALFPSEMYPKTKIEEINLVFKTEQMNRQQNYDKAIADADKFFASGIFDQALEGYRAARGIMPEESYPDEMINRILGILDANAVRDLIGSPVNVGNNEEKRLTFDPVLITDRKSNLIFIKARSTAEGEFKVVLSYGKGNSKNGGYIIPISSNQQNKEYIIPIGKQYTWFSQDNDWISLVPQGGSVEVSLVKISKGN